MLLSQYLEKSAPKFCFILHNEAETAEMEIKPQKTAETTLEIIHQSHSHPFHL